jgi:hypothetical protein
MTALEFETVHAALWAELEQAVRLPERRLDPQRFLALYRTCCEHLALAEARGFPSGLVERLSIVTARAHQIVYRQSDFGIARIARVLLNRFPAAGSAPPANQGHAPPVATWRSLRSCSLDRRWLSASPCITGRT